MFSPTSHWYRDTPWWGPEEFLGVQGRTLCGLPVPGTPEPERLEGGGAYTVGAAINAEEEPAGLAGGDEIATAVRTGVTVTVMPLDVFADLLEIVKDLAIWYKKEIFGNHICSALLDCGLNLLAPKRVSLSYWPRC